MHTGMMDKPPTTLPDLECLKFLKTVVNPVFANPFLLVKDQRMKDSLMQAGVNVRTFNAYLIYEPWEVSKTSGWAFTTFNEFWDRCLSMPESLLLRYYHPLVSSKCRLVYLKSLFHLFGSHHQHVPNASLNQGHSYLHCGEFGAPKQHGESWQCSFHRKVVDTRVE
ncbi:hypothetical protein L7F22_037871 [Adiantum nelumboides]|nr:hypothetical protein [Adiantum nelumboides]